MSTTLLYSDETGHYCQCGGRLREVVVESEVKRRYRLIVPEELWDTREKLRRWTDRPSDDGARVEVAKGRRKEQLVTLVVVE